MVVSHPAGLGRAGTYTVDNRAPFIFANASFIRGPFWGDVTVHNGVAHRGALALARSVYDHLA